MGTLRWGGGILGVAVVLTGCGDPVTGPVGGEVIALETVDGQPLPATVDEGLGRLLVYRADTIHLGENDRWARRTVTDLTRPTMGTQTLDYRQEGTVEWFGGEIVLSYECNDTGSCIAPDRLIPEQGSYRMEVRVGPEAVRVLRFRPVTGGGP